MADKIPVKANFTGADVTSLGEFAAGDTVPVANGGTGATTAAAALTNLGLGNVDNTSDAAKPVSTATQTALNAKAALAGSASQSFSMLNGTVAGTLSLTGAASTLGYGTGAGGTVTQATSKSTAVTLNKPCGQITMNGEALAAGATASFTFANNLLAVGDILLVQVTSPISGSNHYSVTAVSVGSTACTINLKNEYSASLSNSPVIGFVIVKGATS